MFFNMILCNFAKKNLMQMINSVVFIEKDLNDSKNNAHQCRDQEIIVVFAIFFKFLWWCEGGRPLFVEHRLLHKGLMSFCVGISKMIHPSVYTAKEQLGNETMSQRLEANYYCDKISGEV
jgi:hypothetical protein